MVICCCWPPRSTVSVTAEPWPTPRRISSPRLGSSRASTVHRHHQVAGLQAESRELRAVAARIHAIAAQRAAGENRLRPQQVAARLRILHEQLAHAVGERGIRRAARVLARHARREVRAGAAGQARQHERLARTVAVEDHAIRIDREQLRAAGQARCRSRRRAPACPVAPMMAQPCSGSRPASVPVSARFAEVAGASDGSPVSGAMPNRCALTIAGRSTVGAAGGRSGTAADVARRRNRARARRARRAGPRSRWRGGPWRSTAPRPQVPGRRPRGGARARRFDRLAACGAWSAGPGKPRHDTGCRRAATRRKGRENDVTTGTCATLLKLGLQSCRQLANAGPVTCATGSRPL